MTNYIKEKLLIILKLDKYMTTLNRQIKTGHDNKDGVLTLKALKEITIGGVDMKAGDTIQATRSVARRLMSLNEKAFEISLD